MLRALSILFLVVFSSASPFKYLCYSPRFASSHVNYLGKLSDSLVDAGHEVILLSPILDTHVRGAGSIKARIIEIPQSESGRSFETNMNGNLMDKSWQSGETWEVLQSWDAMFDLWADQCNSTLNYPGLLDKLRAEKIDVGFGESMDWCMSGLFHLIGIKKFAVTESIALKEGFYPITQVATVPSYVPSIMGGSFTDHKNFFQRAFNFFNLFMYQRFNFITADRYQKLFEQNYPGFPCILGLMADNSLFFLNSDALVDFPRPSAARLIDLGGIAVSNGYNKLDKDWSSIFDLRPKTVLMSFGTFAKAWVMPEEYKNTIRDTARAFPDVTFIWKYEKPDHNVTQGISNLIESTWVPQHDMLLTQQGRNLLPIFIRASERGWFIKGRPQMIRVKLPDRTLSSSCTLSRHATHTQRARAYCSGRLPSLCLRHSLWTGKHNGGQLCRGSSNCRSRYLRSSQKCIPSQEKRNRTQSG